MELSPQTWSALNVDGKLIAMAIGLSDQAKNIYQRQDFERIYKNSVSSNGILASNV